MIRALGSKIHPLPVRRAERIMWPPSSRDSLDYLPIRSIDHPPRGVIAGEVHELSVRRTSELIGPRPDLHPPDYRIGEGVQPNKLPLFGLRVFDRDEDLVAGGRRDEAMRLGPHFNPP